MLELVRKVDNPIARGEADVRGAILLRTSENRELESLCFMLSHFAKLDFVRDFSVHVSDGSPDLFLPPGENRVLVYDELSTGIRPLVS